MSKKVKNGNPEGSPAEVLLHRDLSTNTQLGMLLSVCGNLAPVLFKTEMEFESVPGQRVLPGEAKIAAENAFNAACEQITEIISDKRRWGIDYQLLLEKQYNERHAEQMTQIKAHTEAESERLRATLEFTTPHFRFKPALFQTEEGWIAFLGDLEDLDTGIIGIGTSPGEALRQFDRAFDGGVSKEVAEWLKQHESALERGLRNTEPFPQDENATKLESNGNHSTENPPSGGENNPADSNGPGA